MSSHNDPPNDFTFPEGDINIKVKVGDEIITGKVTRNAMAAASPVWKRFVNPPWGEATSIDFSEDDPEALLILLRIVHLHFKEVPKAVSKEQLWHIAILCDQYLCVGLTEPWLKLWFLAEDNVAETAFVREQWLFIYWTFGMEEKLASMASLLVNQGTVDDQGRLLAANGSIVPEPTPPKLIESILDRRRLHIANLLEIGYGFVDKSSRVPVDNFQLGPALGCFHNDISCNADIYKYFTAELSKKGLWPRVTADDIHICYTALRWIIYELGFSQKLKEKLKHEWCRARCDYGWYSLRSDRLESESPILECHKIHMAAQRLLVGELS